MSDPTPVILVTAGVLAAFATGALAGYVARGRANRGELAAATAAVVMFNSAEVRDDLAEVGPVTGDHPKLYDQDAEQPWVQAPSLPRSLPDPARRFSAWQPATPGRRP